MYRDLFVLFGQQPDDLEQTPYPDYALGIMHMFFYPILEFQPKMKNGGRWPEVSKPACRTLVPLPRFFFYAHPDVGPRSR